MKVKINQNYKIRIIPHLIKIFKTLFKMLYFTKGSQPPLTELSLFDWILKR